MLKNEKLNEYIGKQKRIARIETDQRKIKHRVSTGGGASTAYLYLRVKFPKRKITHSEWMESMVNSKDKRDRDFGAEALGKTRFRVVKSGKLKVESIYYRGNSEPSKNSRG